LLQARHVGVLIATGLRHGRHRTGRRTTMSTSPATETIGHELVITRTIDAPRSLVFNAWTDPRHMAQWWGPHGFTNPVCELDVRPGGAIRIVMRAPDGTDYPMTGVFHEIKEPERLVITTAVDDKDGNRILEVHTSVVFAETGGKTTLTLRTRVIKSTAAAAGMLAGMKAGWTQSLERLERYVAKA
jgi:uncharacterized protein YndB with AHSA1/START domain